MLFLQLLQLNRMFSIGCPTRCVFINWAQTRSVKQKPKLAASKYVSKFWEAQFKQMVTMQRDLNAQTNKSLVGYT